MRTRTLLLTALALTLVAPTTSAIAKAKPKPPPCNVLTDAPGDSHNGYNDILSADIATGKTELVAVLRLTTTVEPTDLLSTLDYYQWTFSATLNGTDYIFGREQKWMHAKPTTYVVVGSTQPPYTFFVKGNTLEWHVKRSDLPSLTKKKNQKFTQIRSTTWYKDSSDDNGLAPVGKYYQDKGPSCVVAK